MVRDPGDGVDQATSSAPQKQRSLQSSKDSDILQRRNPLRRGISATVPRVEQDAALIMRPPSRPTSRESRGSTPRSIREHSGAHASANKIAPPNLESLTSVQRLSVRKPSSQDSPRLNDGIQKDGTKWIQESVDQLREFAELNRTITNLWQTAMKVDLVSLPPDPRLHSTIGRKHYEEDRQAWLRQQTGDGPRVNDDAHTIGVAINQFTGLFTAEDASGD